MYVYLYVCIYVYLLSLNKKICTLNRISHSYTTTYDPFMIFFLFLDFLPLGNFAFFGKKKMDKLKSSILQKKKGKKKFFFSFLFEDALIVIAMFVVVVVVVVVIVAVKVACENHLKYGVVKDIFCFFF